MQTERMTLPDGGSIDVLVAPVGDAAGAVILLSPIFGVDDEFAAIAGDWANAGFVALAPDYYHRAGAGPLPRDADGFRAAIDRWKRWHAATALEDLRVVGERARVVARGGPVGVIGYCAGGELALIAAGAGLADAVAIFHAARLDRYPDILRGLNIPTTLHFGGGDRMVPSENVAAVEAAVADNAAVEVFVHPAAEHGYTFAAQPAYDAQAARLSFERARAMLERAETRAAA